MSWMIPTYVALGVAGLAVLGVLAYRVLGEIRALARATAAAGNRLGTALAELERAAGALPERGAGVPSSLTPE